MIAMLDCLKVDIEVLYYSIETVESDECKRCQKLTKLPMVYWLQCRVK